MKKKAVARAGCCPHCGKRIPPSVASAVLSKLGAVKGGLARAKALPKRRRVAIARKASLAAKRRRKEHESD